MIALDTYQMHGPLLCLSDERKRLLSHMTADLRETGNWRVRIDAVRQLHHDGYKVLDVLILVDEAVFECKQEVIARAMSDEGLNHLATADGAALNAHPGIAGSAS